MAKPFIKICGLRDPEMTEQAAKMGAHYIGIIFDSLSPRYVDLDQAIRIAHVARKSGALPVGVFVNHTNKGIRYICEAANIDIVQLHGTCARQYHPFLPDHYQRIFVINVSHQGELIADKAIQHLDPQRDFILIDHLKPGEGNRIFTLRFHYDMPFPWILAGGLSPLNVVNAIKKLKPSGVDVSSGVESSRGNKNKVLVQQFITEIKGCFL